MKNLSFANEFCIYVRLLVLFLTLIPAERFRLRDLGLYPAACLASLSAIMFFPWWPAVQVNRTVRWQSLAWQVKPYNVPNKSMFAFSSPSLIHLGYHWVTPFRTYLLSVNISKLFASERRNCFMASMHACSSARLFV